VSRRDGGGDDTTGSDDEEFSAEDEFRRWAEAAEAGPADAPGDNRGWAARIFGRKSKSEEQSPAFDESVTPEPGPAPEPDRGPAPEDLEASGPEQLGVFRAIKPGEGPPSELRSSSGDAVAATSGEVGMVQAADETDEAPEPPPAIAPTAAAETGGEVGDEPPPAPAEFAPSAAPEPPLSAAPVGVPDFTELWQGHGESDDFDDASVDEAAFSEFTSEDYLAATTREYAGLAEAVARAEEEGTRHMAVSAEIRGLESGVVGLDDVVDAEGVGATTDLIEPPASSELSIRVLTAAGLVVLFAASLLSPYGIGALIFVVLGVAAGEMYSAFIRGGYRPLSIFGFLGIAGAFAGTWIAGPVAVPIALLVTAVAVFLFYATAPGRKGAVENASLTVLVTVWIGGLGAFAFDLLGSDDYIWLVLGLVVTVAAMDIAQYFIGHRLGRRALAPVISPKKTVEGYVAGIVVAIAVGAAFAWAPPFELSDGLLIGVVVAIVGPIGDLAVSVVKRALDIKDMGYILPGHGGVMDRVDAMIAVIPALWIAYSWMGLLH
jgi:phosphatidate cytidylyltransferase